MRKNLLLVLCLISTISASGVYALEIKNAAGGALKSATSSVKTTATSADTTTIRKSIKGLNYKLALADKDVQAAFSALVSALSSKEEAAKIKAQINAINANTNLSAAEKSAKLAEIMSDYGDNLKNANDELKGQLKSASSAKTDQILAALEKLTDATVKYTDLLNDVQSIVTQIAYDPTLAMSMKGDFTEIKETGKILKSNLKSLKNVSSGAFNLCKSCGIKVQKTASKSSSTKKVDFSKLGK